MAWRGQYSFPSVRFPATPLSSIAFPAMMALLAAPPVACLFLASNTCFFFFFRFVRLAFLAGAILTSLCKHLPWAMYRCYTHCTSISGGITTGLMAGVKATLSLRTSRPPLSSLVVGDFCLISQIGGQWISKAATLRAAYRKQICWI